MANRHGDPLWYELLTRDADTAGRFYGAVVGWRFGDAPEGPVDYRMIEAESGPVAGVMPLNEPMLAGGARPVWLGYVAVDDVDAAVEGIVARGGAVHMPAMDMDGVGRMAMVADPAGAPFYVMRGASEESSDSFAQGPAGHCCWNELATTDPEAAFAFYGELFGWTRDGAMPMGSEPGAGEYSFIGANGTGIGAVMPVQGDDAPHWLYYFQVDDIDRALAAARGGGGSVLEEPVEIPGGGWSARVADPEGAAFGLVSDRRGGA